MAGILGLTHQWSARLITHGDSKDAYVVDHTFAPGSDSGWPSRPGPSLVFVVAGTVTPTGWIRRIDEPVPANCVR